MLDSLCAGGRWCSGRLTHFCVPTPGRPIAGYGRGPGCECEVTKHWEDRLARRAQVKIAARLLAGWMNSHEILKINKLQFSRLCSMVRISVSCLLSAYYMLATIPSIFLVTFQLIFTAIL